jgi:hypothetical protein
MRRLLTIAFALAMTAAAATASAQVSLVGDWRGLNHEDPTRGSSELGDFTGLPVIPEAIAHADAWDESRWTLQERQCIPHSSTWAFRGPAQIRIWEEKDPTTQDVVAIKTFIATFAQTRTIWMDGRPHPGRHAPHTWQGFSTGTWNGNRLTVTTTHLKRFYRRRNGVPESDQVTQTEHFIRHGNNYMTHVMIAEDPVYLTEPMISANYTATNAVVQPSLGRPLSGGAANVTVNIVEPGTMYGDRMNQLDVRMGRNVPIGRGRTMLNFDVYNVLNANAVLTENSAFGRWRQPTNVLQGRLGKISLQFDF